MKHVIRPSSDPTSASVPVLTIGIDVGDRRSHACVVDGSRTPMEEFSFETSAVQLCRKLRREPCQVILEVGPHSRWMQKSLEGLGHTVRIVDARRIQLISKSNHKTDKRDARTLAQLGAGVPELERDEQPESAAESLAPSDVEALEELLRQLAGLAPTEA